MKHAWVGALAVVVLANAFAIGPVWRERAGDVRRVTIVACPAQVAGGYGEMDRLRLMIHADAYDPGPAGIDAAGLAALGFDENAIAGLGDSASSYQRLASVRPAWVRIQQRPDSGRAWQVLAVGPTRQSVEGEGLIVKGRIGFAYEARGTVGLRRVAQVFSTVPTSLYLTSTQAERLRELRSSDVQCTKGMPVVIGNGRDGGAWVESVP